MDAFHYDLPTHLIATHPAQRRDHARLLHVPPGDAAPSDHHFHELPALLHAGDLLVINDSRVVPARVHVLRPGGSVAELLLVTREDDLTWRALARPARKLTPGMRLALAAPAMADANAWFEVLAQEPDAAHATSPDPGQRRVRLHLPANAPSTNPRAAADALLLRAGEMPLPPYIVRERRARGEATADAIRADEPADAERYQTVYAAAPGSVAAPTAGLHFTPELLAALQAAGIEVARVTLHVGLGTFAPLTPEQLASGRLHEEVYEITPTAAAAIEAARLDPARRVVAVGTTSVRTLESCLRTHGAIVATRGTTDLFIRPGDPIRAVDAMVTNFHLPDSSLLMLVAAFAGRERILAAYATAIARGYRFFSYGDAMLLEP